MKFSLAHCALLLCACRHPSQLLAEQLSSRSSYQADAPAPGASAAASLRSTSPDGGAPPPLPAAPPAAAWSSPGITSATRGAPPLQHNLLPSLTSTPPARLADAAPAVGPAAAAAGGAPLLLTSRSSEQLYPEALPGEEADGQLPQQPKSYRRGRFQVTEHQPRGEPHSRRASSSSTSSPLGSSGPPSPRGPGGCCGPAAPQALRPAGGGLDCAAVHLEAPAPGAPPAQQGVQVPGSRPPAAASFCQLPPAPASACYRRGRFNVTLGGAGGEAMHASSSMPCVAEPPGEAVAAAAGSGQAAGAGAGASAVVAGAGLPSHRSHSLPGSPRRDLLSPSSSSLRRAQGAGAAAGSWPEAAAAGAAAAALLLSPTSAPAASSRRASYDVLPERWQPSNSPGGSPGLPPTNGSPAKAHAQAQATAQAQARPAPTAGAGRAGGAGKAPRRAPQQPRPSPNAGSPASGGGGVRPPARLRLSSSADDLQPLAVTDEDQSLRQRAAAAGGTEQGAWGRQLHGSFSASGKLGPSLLQQLEAAAASAGGAAGAWCGQPLLPGDSPEAAAAAGPPATRGYCRGRFTVREAVADVPSRPPSAPPGASTLEAAALVLPPRLPAAGAPAAGAGGGALHAVASMSALSSGSRSHDSSTLASWRSAHSGSGRAGAGSGASSIRTSLDGSGGGSGAASGRLTPSSSAAAAAAASGGLAGVGAAAVAAAAVLTKRVGRFTVRHEAGAGGASAPASEACSPRCGAGDGGGSCWEAAAGHVPAGSKEGQQLLKAALSNSRRSHGGTAPEQQHVVVVQPPAPGQAGCSGAGAGTATAFVSVAAPVPSSCAGAAAQQLLPASPHEDESPFVTVQVSSERVTISIRQP